MCYHVNSGFSFRRNINGISLGYKVMFVVFGMVDEQGDNSSGNNRSSLEDTFKMLN